VGPRATDTFRHAINEAPARTGSRDGVDLNGDGHASTGGGRQRLIATSACRWHKHRGTFQPVGNYLGGGIARPVLRSANSTKDGKTDVAAPIGASGVNPHDSVRTSGRRGPFPRIALARGRGKTFSAPTRYKHLCSNG